MSDMSALISWERKTALRKRLELLKAFDPNQARDAHGRWTRSGVPTTTPGGFGRALGEASARTSQIAGHISLFAEHVARAAAASSASNYAYLAFHVMNAASTLSRQGFSRLRRHSFPPR
jgi:hypothetical protein